MNIEVIWKTVKIVESMIKIARLLVKTISQTFVSFAC